MVPSPSPTPHEGNRRRDALPRQTAPPPPRSRPDTNSSDGASARGRRRPRDGSAIDPATGFFPAVGAGFPRRAFRIGGRARYPDRQVSWLSWRSPPVKRGGPARRDFSECRGLRERECRAITALSSPPIRNRPGRGLLRACGKADYIAGGVSRRSAFQVSPGLDLGARPRYVFCNDTMSPHSQEQRTAFAAADWTGARTVLFVISTAWSKRRRFSLPSDKNAGHRARNRTSAWSNCTTTRPSEADWSTSLPQGRRTGNSVERRFVGSPSARSPEARLGSCRIGLPVSI